MGLMRLNRVAYGPSPCDKCGKKPTEHWPTGGQPGNYAVPEPSYAWDCKCHDWSPHATHQMDNNPLSPECVRCGVWGKPDLLKPCARSNNDA